MNEQLQSDQNNYADGNRDNCNTLNMELAAEETDTVPGDDDFKNDILIRDLAEEIVVNSQITVKKYSLFRKAVLADIVAFIFAITTFVAA